jgi:hypothetical protein
MADDELLLATSRTLPSEFALNDDAAAAREAFLSLGAALESASGFDEAALVRRLHAACLSAQEPAGKASLAERTKLRRWWPLVVGAALAASLAGFFFVPGDTVEKRQPMAVISEAQKPIEAHNAPQQPIDSAVAQNAASGETSDAAENWRDPLDDEISLAAATIGQLAGHASGLDDSLLEINDRLEALVHELQTETL